MVSSAYVYLSEHECPDETNWRIDVIAIALSRSQPPVIDHVEDALDW